LTRFRSFIFIA